MSQIEQMQEWIDHHSKRADHAEAINAELLRIAGMARDYVREYGSEHGWPLAVENDARLIDEVIAKATAVESSGGEAGGK